MKWFETQVDVRYADTDQMGIVHHAVFACYCEIGRTYLCAQLGLAYADWEKRGVFLMVAAMQSRFIAPARYGQPLMVQTAISRLNRRILDFSYQILDAHSKQLLFSGSTTHVFTMGVGRPFRLHDDLYDMLMTAV